MTARVNLDDMDKLWADVVALSGTTDAFAPLAALGRCAPVMARELRELRQAAQHALLERRCNAPGPGGSCGRCAHCRLRAALEVPHG